MRRVAMLFLAAAALTSGCADNQETLIVLHVPAWPDDGACVIDPATEDGLLFGRLDLRGNTPYFMPAVLLNNTGDQRTNNTGVDSNEIQLIDADVVIDSPQASDMIDMLPDALTHFTVGLSTNSIPQGEAVGVGVEVLPQGTVNALVDAFNATQDPTAKVSVRANVVFNGTRTANNTGSVGRVKARDFSFPIQLCYDCLLDCSGCTNSEGDPTGCPLNLGPNDLVGGVCGNAQDRLVWPAACMAPGD
jgi:hypothetical protein